MDVKNKVIVNIYLPFAFCSFDLLVQIPTQRHQHHAIIRCMLQKKTISVMKSVFSYLNDNEIFHIQYTCVI